MEQASWNLCHSKAQRYAVCMLSAIQYVCRPANACGPHGIWLKCWAGMGHTIDATSGAPWPGKATSGSSSKSAAMSRWLGRALQMRCNRCKQQVGSHRLSLLPSLSGDTALPTAIPIDDCVCFYSICQVTSSPASYSKYFWPKQKLSLH